MVLVAKSRKAHKRSVRKIALIVMLSFIILSLITMSVMLGNYINSRTTIFPNVWAEGFNVSGLTVEQARQALIDGGYENNAVGISITVELPYDISFSVTGDDVGLTLNAGDAARSAYAYGRDSTFFGNQLSFIKAFLGKIELYNLSIKDYDNTIIQELADEYTGLFNAELYGNNLVINDNNISIVKGTGYASAAAEEVFNFADQLMRQAIEQHAHLTDRFVPGSNADDSDIDLQSVFNYIHKDPVSSRYDKTRGNPNSDSYDPVNLGATESATGLTFDLPAAIDAFHNAAYGSDVMIPLITLQPELTQAELKSMLYRDVIAERETSQGSPAARATNIRLASEAIDGLVMQPGDTFSYNDVVGPRTEERGYQEANAYEGGVVVQELGGGICQVSSTIYAALLQTDLEIVSRRPHGMRVGYLFGGQDATVVYGLIDFVFKNNSDYPIRLEVVTRGSITITVRIHGTRTSDVYYKIVSEEHENQPNEMRIIERPVTDDDGIELAPGERREIAAGYQGQRWEVWKYHYSAPDFDNDDNRILDSNGNHVRTLANTSLYPTRDKVIIYNPNEYNPDRNSGDDNNRE